MKNKIIKGLQIIIAIPLMVIVLPFIAYFISKDIPMMSMEKIW